MGSKDIESNVTGGVRTASVVEVNLRNILVCTLMIFRAREGWKRREVPCGYLQ